MSLLLAVNTPLRRREARAVVRKRDDRESDLRPTTAGITAADMHRYVRVKPTTIARVEFVEWTNAGKLRHPKFQTLIDNYNVEKPVSDSATAPEAVTF